MSFTERVEWEDAAIHPALRVATEQLLFIAEELQQLSGRWHAPVCERIGLQAEDVRGWGETAMLSRDQGDRWTRLEALELARERISAAEILLSRWRHRTHTYQNTPLTASGRARSIGA